MSRFDEEREYCFLCDMIAWCPGEAEDLRYLDDLGPWCPDCWEKAGRGLAGVEAEAKGLRLRLLSLEAKASAVVHLGEEVFSTKPAGFVLQENLSIAIQRLKKSLSATKGED